MRSHRLAGWAFLLLLSPFATAAIRPQDGVYRGTLGPGADIYKETGGYHNSFTIYPPPAGTRVVFEVVAQGFTPVMRGVWSDGQGLSAGSRFDRVSKDDGLIYLILTTGSPGETGSYELTITMGGRPVDPSKVMRVVETKPAPGRAPAPAPASARPATASAPAPTQGTCETPAAMEALERGRNLTAAAGREAETVEAFTQAIRLDPACAPAYYQRAFVYQRLSEYDRSLADITRYLELGPRQTYAFNLQGWLYLERNDAGAAILAFNEALRLDPRNSMAFNNRGRAHARRGDAGAAIADYTRAIEINPGDKMALNNRANQYRKQGRIDAARQDYRRALEIDPAYELAQRNLDELERTAAQPPPSPPAPSAPARQAPAQPPAQPGLPGATDPSGRVLGIMVGISNYQGRVTNLKYTAADAGRVRDALVKGARMRPADGIVLTDEAATADAFRQAIGTIAARVRPNDLVVLFFSGHGGRYRRASLQPQEPDGYDESLEMVDGPILDDELNSLLGRLGGVRTLLVFDSCFSGGFSKDVISAPDRMGMFSSEEDVTSAVAARFRAGGYLASFLAEAIGDHAADEDSDRRLTAIELSQYIHERYREDVKGPVPEYVSGSVGMQHFVVDRGSIAPYQVLFVW